MALRAHLLFRLLIVAICEHLLFVQYKTITNKKFADLLIFFAHFQTFTSKVLKNMPDLSTPQLHDKWLCHTLKLLLYAVPQINEKKLNFVIYLIIPLAPVQFIVYSIYWWASLLWTNHIFLNERIFCEQRCRSEEFRFKNCLGTFFWHPIRPFKPCLTIYCIQDLNEHRVLKNKRFYKMNNFIERSFR